LKGTDRFVVDDVVCAVHGATLKVANISVGGLFAATRSAPPVGEMLEMDVELKGRPPFRVTGKVAWINEAEEPKAPDLPQGFGIQITRIGLADKLAIVDVLKRTPPAQMRERRRESREEA